MKFFFPSTFIEWNTLNPNVQNVASLSCFQKELVEIY